MRSPARPTVGAGQRRTDSVARLLLRVEEEAGEPATRPRGEERLREKLLLRVEEAAGALGIGRTILYELIRSGELVSVRVGRRRLVPIAALRAYVETLTSEIS